LSLGIRKSSAGPRYVCESIIGADGVFIHFAAVDARKCYATGRGIQPKGVRVSDDADFKVHTRGAGEGDLNVKVIGPGGSEERVRVRRLDPVTFECAYQPKKPGPYVVNVQYGGQPIAKSPFRVDVGPERQTRIRAFGPGLENGVVGYPACFTVETNGETGALGEGFALNA
jgi:filamin